MYICAYRLYSPALQRRNISDDPRCGQYTVCYFPRQFEKGEYEKRLVNMNILNGRRPYIFCKENIFFY